MWGSLPCDSRGATTDGGSPHQPRDRSARRRGERLYLGGVATKPAHATVPVCGLERTGSWTSFGSATAFGDGHAGAGLARLLTVALLRS